ncbi:MAG: alpha-amylase family glycosyl hydrolase [Bacteroidia bacterium]
MKKQLFLFLTFLLLQNQLNAQQKTNNIPGTSKYPNCVFYEIFIRSFYDSNGDGIGDINGIAQKLDYLQTLGVQGLWITPVNPSPSYHKYDVTDYYNIDKEYGTLNDYKTLIKEAHKRNIKLLMDMVINHCSSQHPWFKDAVANPKGEYRNYFVWKNPAEVTDEKDHWYVIRNNRAENLIHAQNFQPGEQAYYGFFSSEMPDLNYDNPKVRSEMIKAGKFWFQEVGVDGYRLDAAKWIFPPGEETKNYAWWQEFTAAMRNVKPDAFFVGEITDSYSLTAPYLKNALTSVFNFDLGFDLIESLKEEKDTSIVNLVKTSRDYFLKASPQFIDATFITNHDQNRIGSEMQGNIQKMKLAAAILLTLPGSPFVYYGEEIGMLGTKPDENIREPFLWNTIDKDLNRCKWMTPKFSTDTTVVPLALQIGDVNSIYDHYKKLIELRNANRVLNSGNIQSVNFNDDELLAYNRILGENSLLVIHNLTGKSKTVELKSLSKKYSHIIYSSKINSEFDGTSINIVPYQSVVLQ